MDSFDNFRLFRVQELAVKQVEKYYEDLLAADLLKYRHPGILKPGVEEAMNSIFEPRTVTVFLLDMDDFDIMTEVQLNNIQGLSATAHFTVNPDLRGQNIEVGKRTIEEIFKLTYPSGHDYLHTLIGLIPKTNRLAQRYVENIGFEPKTVIPKAFHLARFGKMDDGILSVRTKE